MASMEEAKVKVQHEITGMPRLKCLTCFTESAMAESEGREHNPIRDAVTLAPMWLSQRAGMQTIMACVAVPSCAEHLTYKEKTNEERAIEGGFLLGRPGMNGEP